MQKPEARAKRPDGRFPVAVIGLDACDPDLVERWSREGRLPFLSSLMQAGARARLLSSGALFSDSPWPSFAAGVSPAKHGFYNSQHIVRGTTRIETTRAAYGRYLPFWWLLRNGGKKAAIFDVPKTGTIPGVDGLQVSSWGEHYGLYRNSSLPLDLIKELNAKFGRYRHPGEIVTPRRLSQEERVYRRIGSALEQKLGAAKFLMAQDDWDLFVAVFAETHYGGHQFLHHFDPTHWGHAEHPHMLDDSLPSIYAQLDAAAAELVGNTVPEDTTVFVVSVHGIETNYSANHLIPAVLEGLGLQAPAVPRSQEVGASDGGDLVRRLRGMVPGSLREMLNRYVLPQSVQDRLFSRMFAARIDWRKTTAFFLPSGDFQGFVSVNLQGREPWGVVRPGAEYREVCERIRAELKQLINPATGKSAVRDVVVTAGVYEGENLYELADLVILWANDAPIEALHHPKLGTLSRAHEPLRKSQHAPEGFMIAAGKHIKRHVELADARVVDLAPTILYLMGQPIPNDMDGKVLMEVVDEDFKARHQPRFESRPDVVLEEMRL